MEKEHYYNFDIAVNRHKYSVACVIIILIMFYVLGCAAVRSNTVCILSCQAASAHTFSNPFRQHSMMKMAVLCMI